MKLILIVILASTTVFADRGDRRQHRQRARIAEGVKSGELTHEEAQGLRKEQRRIRRVERRLEADGVKTPGEAARIERLQDKASENIKSEKHDDDKK